MAALHTSARAVEQRTGLTNAQLFLLRHVADAGSLTMTELAARSRAAQSAVSIVIAKLVRGGHVRRGRVEGDARRVTLTATARGRSVLRRAPRPATDRLLDAIAAIPPREARALSRSIGVLLEELGARPTSAPLLFEPVRARGR